MQIIYIFVSDLRAGVRAFTADPTGTNLPTEYGPWHAVNGGRAMAIGSDQDPVARGCRPRRLLSGDSKGTCAVQGCT
jgi:hypothetical protein